MYSVTMQIKSWQTCWFQAANVNEPLSIARQLTLHSVTIFHEIQAWAMSVIYVVMCVRMDMILRAREKLRRLGAVWVRPRFMNEDSLKERPECQHTQDWKRDWQVTESGPQKCTENSRWRLLGFCICDKAVEEYVGPLLQGRDLRQKVRTRRFVHGILALQKT